MAITKQRTLDYIELEWGTYIERFNCLPRDEQQKRMKEQGYERFRDMLAHILAWWVEGMGIILAIAEDRPLERRKYDFDAFNAEAVAKHRDWEETELLARFEETRLKMAADLGSMNEAVFENRRVRAWLDGIIYHHAREHLVALSRFIVIDLLENEWKTYVEDFNHLDYEKRKEFLSKQGFESFHDLLAHILGWWEEGIRIINKITNDPSFQLPNLDVDAFNRELVQKYGTLSDDVLFNRYHSVRDELLALTKDLPDDAFLNRDIEGWLKDDVVEHYDEHPVPA